MHGQNINSPVCPQHTKHVLCMLWCVQNSRWRTAAILKIVISPYLSEKSSDFEEILYTAADFEHDERHVIKNKKSCIGQTPSSTERISCWTHKIQDGGHSPS